MHSTTRLLDVLIVLVLGVGAAGAHAAGTVQVSYIEADRFTDVGHTRSDVDDNLRRLTRHFEALAARHLADGQKLSVEVLEVDLAGELRPAHRSGQDIRVLKGTVDWPRIKLRYTLEGAGQLARSGERTLQDMAYLQHLVSSVGKDGLPYEYRLLEDWFNAEFGRTGTR